MTALQALALYAGLNLILLIFLAVNVSRHRRRAKVSLGTGTDASLEQACRAHGNAAEYMPAALVGLAIIATLGASTLLVNVLGVTVTLGRFLHAYGLLTDGGPSMGRVVGTALTWLGILAMAVVLLWMSVT